MEAMNREEVIINDGTMQQYCINHPHRKNPAGICAFCLQEKLGKLVSSSSSSSFPSSSSSSFSSPPSSSPSFRFNTLQTSSSSSSSLNSLSLPPTSSSSSSTTKRDHHIRSRIPFLLPNKKKPSSHSSSANVTSSDSVFKRSKSTTTPRRTKFLDNDDAENGDFAFRKRNSFWSFLYLSSRPSSSCSKKMEVKSFKESNSSPRISTVKPKFCSSTLGRNCEMVVEEENEEEEEEEEEEVSGSSSGSGSLEQRKVSRSRSVGCGSRSFSGDLFEKISTGFGDCSLRRVESQREGKANKVISSSGCMKERVKCGGIFGGFMMMSSSSSYWVSSGDDGENSHGRSRSSWSWALASPMRAFTNKTTSKRDANSQNNNAPNLSAVPSLLTIKG